MLFEYLQEFNATLKDFREKFPLQAWTPAFKQKLFDDYTFFSSRIENSKLQYGETIKFLRGELVRKENLSTLLEVSTHKEVLDSLLDKYENFELSEDSIKEIHFRLMSIKYHSEDYFDHTLAGKYRHYPVVGRREPLYPNKEYTPHYNLEFAMASYMDSFTHKFKSIDNSNNETHLITALAFFHNIFLNLIHPFADGNGRVCRIILGIVMMKNDCPPIFSQIFNDDDMKHYIDTLIKCENEKSDEPLIKLLATGMTAYMKKYLV